MKHWGILGAISSIFYYFSRLRKGGGRKRNPSGSGVIRNRERRENNHGSGHGIGREVVGENAGRFGFGFG